jgi:hypothetical protein
LTWESLALFRSTLLALLAFCLFSVAQSQTAPTRIYRGAIGDKHIEMRLNIAGSQVDGTYFYDQFKQDIKLEGTFDSKGELSLNEGAGKKKTGKFVCKAEPEAPDTDLECEWSRVDGTGSGWFTWFSRASVQKRYRARSKGHPRSED